MKLAEYERNYGYAIAQKTAIEATAAAVAQQQVAAAAEAQTALSVVEVPSGYVSST